jgi:hypothetical protein
MNTNLFLIRWVGADGFGQYPIEARTAAAAVKIFLAAFRTRKVLEVVAY